VAEPDPSRCRYDEASGYYYDPLTGYYYDANTRYYYDPEQQSFLCWNDQLKQYTPVLDKPGSTAQEPESSYDKEKSKKKDKGDKVKPSKNVAKVCSSR
jgi:RNA-binding protein 5/10